MKLKSLFDSKIKVLSLLVAVVSAMFAFLSYTSNRASVKDKENNIQALAIELFNNSRKNKQLRDSISTLNKNYKTLTKQRDSLLLLADSVNLISQTYLTQINELYEKIDSLSVVPIDVPDSEQLRIFLKWSDPR